MRRIETVTMVTSPLLVLALGLLLAAIHFTPARAESELWHRTYDWGTVDYAYSVAVDSGDNVVVTGSSTQDYQTWHGYYTLKYDSSGNKLWDKTYEGGHGNDLANSVAVDSGDNVIVTGFSYDGTTLNYYTIKYSPEGDLLWDKVYDSGLADGALDIAVDSDDNIVISGASSNGTTMDYYTIKYSPDGNELWHQVYDSGYDDRAYGVVVDSQDNVVITGSHSTPPSEDGMLREWNCCYTIKYNSDGNELWHTTYDGEYQECAYKVAVDSNDNIIISGKASDESTWNYYTIKYDPNGTELWHRAYDGGYWDAALDVAVDSGDNIMVVGGSGDGTSDNYYIIKYTSIGEVLWSQEYDSGDGDCAYGVAVDSGDNIVVTGISGIGGTDGDYCTRKYGGGGTTPPASGGMSTAAIAGIAVGVSAAFMGIYFATRKWVWGQRR